jgi:uncharacterized protein (TIGR03790 family)
MMIRKVSAQEGPAPAPTGRFTLAGRRNPLPEYRQDNVQALARAFLVWALLTGGSVGAAPARPAATPAARVIVLANSDDADSLQLARYYAEKRGVPAANIYAYKMSAAETIGWPEFVATIWQPLQDDLVRAGWIDAIPMDLVDQAGRRKYVIDGHRIAYLVVCRGVPLRIAANPSWAIEPAVVPLANRPEFLTNQAAVDSELALLAESVHPTGRFVPNVLYQNEAPTAFDAGRVVKTTRLDGPTAEAARALVDHALIAEHSGWLGRAYIDIGGIHEDGDRWLEGVVRQLAELGFDTDVDREPTTMPATARCDAPVLYFGWYAGDLNGPFALPGFRFPPGAIAQHIHSMSAATLRSAHAGWCGPLVDRGVTATVGNVYEPYLQILHRPTLLLRALARGATFGDAAYYALPVLSWQSVAIGDPLYRPVAVSFEEQWEKRRELAPRMSAYVVLRKLRLLEADSRDDEALALARAELAAAPSLPLALAVAGRLARRGDAAGVVATMDFASRLESPTTEEWALLRAAARLLETNGAPAKAAETYRRLLAARELPRELRVAWLGEAARAAAAAHDPARSEGWDRERAELTAAGQP